MILASYSYRRLRRSNFLQVNFEKSKNKIPYAGVPLKIYIKIVLPNDVKVVVLKLYLTIMDGDI